MGGVHPSALSAVDCIWPPPVPPELTGVDIARSIIDIEADMDALVVVTLLNDGIPIELLILAVMVELMCSGDVAVELMFMEPESGSSAGPAIRTLSGRHCTLPRPLANRLSTQLGNAPVVMYS